MHYGNHSFCSFLALVLRKELMDRMAAAGHVVEWADILRDLDRLVETEIQQGAKSFRIRPPAPGCAGEVFAAAGVALPHLVQPVNARPPPDPLPSPQPKPRRKPGVVPRPNR